MQSLLPGLPNAVYSGNELVRESEPALVLCLSETRSRALAEKDFFDIEANQVAACVEIRNLKRLVQAVHGGLSQTYPNLPPPHIGRCVYGDAVRTINDDGASDHHPAIFKQTKFQHQSEVRVLWFPPGLASDATEPVRVVVPYAAGASRGPITLPA
jgi:hypothetical protein